jgi:2Fe-2S ferredoxin
MPVIVVANRQGEERTIDAEPGRSLMQVIRDDSGFSDLIAMCGGTLSCATCHVHIEGATEGALPAMGEDEDALLDGSLNRSALSRLSCQIPVTAALSGIRVTICDD